MVAVAWKLRVLGSAPRVYNGVGLTTPLGTFP